MERGVDNMRTASFQARLASIDDDHQWELSDTTLDAWLKAGVVATYQTHTETAGYGVGQQRNPTAHSHLGRSMKMDHDNGEPLRCSVVINKKWGMPGEQYFQYARSLGYNIPATPAGERAFWDDQITKLGLDPNNLRVV